jgi:hypothetical protein
MNNAGIPSPFPTSREFQNKNGWSPSREVGLSNNDAARSILYRGAVGLGRLLSTF